MSAAVLSGGCTLDPYEVARQQREHERWLSTPVELPVETPAFDERQARQRLVAGKTRVQGSFFHKIVRHGRFAGSEGGVILDATPEEPAANIRVWLMPLTDHVQQWLELEEKNARDRASWLTKNRTRIEDFRPDPRVFRNAWMARTDSSGSFIITGVGPGRYALVCEDVAIFTMRREDHHLGTSYQSTGYLYGGNTVTPMGGTVAHVESQYQRMRTVVRYRKILDVTADQQAIDIGRVRMRTR